MSREEYPLYPLLSEEGKKEAQSLIDEFKKHMSKVADEVLSKLYIEVACHIESDSWTNYRNAMMDGFKNYNNRMVQGEYDFKEIRQAILKEHRVDIIKDLNQDILKENESLKKELESLRQDIRDLHY